MNSVYFIPTNRSIERCAQSYLQEIQYALITLNKKIPFVVMESNSSEIVKKNAQILKKLAIQYPEVEIYHLTIDVQKKYLKELLTEKEKLFDLFVTDHVNYGAAMNKIFLFTPSFGAECFHRRDSDTTLALNYFNSPEEAYPIEIELSFIGKEVKQLRQERILSNSDTIKEEQDEKKICLVGSNYFGEWNLDVKDFAKKDMKIVYRLYELLGFPADSVEEVCNEAFKFGESLGEKDKLTLVTSVDDGLNPDCGNVAVCNIHELLPVLSSKNCLAGDYFTFDVATSLGIPSIHHTRNVFHEYHSERFEYSKKLRYWEAVLKFSDYFTNYMHIFEGKLGQKYEKNSNTLFSEKIKHDLQNTISEFSQKELSVRTSRIKSIITEILLPFNDDYRKLGEYFLPKVKDLILETNQEYLRHVELIENWPDLIKRAKNIRINELTDRM